VGHELSLDIELNALDERGVGRLLCNVQHAIQARHAIRMDAQGSARVRAIHQIAPYLTDFTAILSGSRGAIVGPGLGSFQLLLATRPTVRLQLL
jgi:hypothetical protein